MWGIGCRKYRIVKQQEMINVSCETLQFYIKEARIEGKKAKMAENCFMWNIVFVCENILFECDLKRIKNGGRMVSHETLIKYYAKDKNK